MSVGRTMALSLAALLVSGGSVPASPPDAAAPAATRSAAVTKEEIFDILHFNDDERTRIFKGEIVTRDVEELSDKELSVSLAMIVPVQMDALIAWVRSGRILETDRE